MSTLKTNILDTPSGSGNITVNRPTVLTAGDIITADILDSNVTTAKIADVNVTTAKIADNAITLAKMAGGTDGQVITYDASGDPVAVGPGTDGQVLTSTGAGSPPAFEAVAQLTDNSVTLAKMAGGTDGQIITYDASGDPVAVGPGTDGQVLTSTGAGSPPAFEAVAGGGEVYSSTYYTNPMNSAGAHNITGVGFQPDVVWVQQIANRAVGGISWGMSDGVEEHCFTSYEAINSNTYDDASSNLWKIWENASDQVSAVLTSMDSDGFTFTISETGTYDTPAGTIQFMCFKA